MKQLFPLLVVGVLAYIVWTRVINADPPNVKLFKQVAEAWVVADMATIRPYCKNPTIESSIERRSLDYLMGSKKIGQIVGFEYGEVSVTPGETEEQSTVKATQTVMFNPPGVDSEAYASWLAVINYSVTLSLVVGEWQIDHFEAFLESAGEKGYK